MAVLVALKDRSLRERVGGAISLRFPVTLSDGLPQDPDRYDVLVVDLDDVHRLKGLEASLIAVVHPDGDDLEELELADDFVSARASEKEFLLRVTRAMRRGKDGRASIRIRDLVIYPDSYEVFLSGRPVVLSLKEYELLKLLASRPGRVFTREAILDAVWGEDYFGGSRTVDVHIRRLRAKIEVGGRRFIETVRGVGYKMI